MEQNLTPQEDWRHALQPGEHEALYFTFTSEDGALFGILRLLFSYESVLEMVVLRAGEAVWAHQREIAAVPVSEPVSRAAGPSLAMDCLAPWQQWRLQFAGPIARVGSDATQPMACDLTFTANAAATRFRFGPYQQAQQAGEATGVIRLGSQLWEMPLVVYRDHSWGQRPMGASPGWKVAIAPTRLYANYIEMTPQPLCFGRYRAPDGDFVPLTAIDITPADEGWTISAPAVGLEGWQMRRMGPPVVVYLGEAGVEQVRPEPHPGDLYRDELSPVRFTTETGEELPGFLELARSVNHD